MSPNRAVRLWKSTIPGTVALASGTALAVHRVRVQVQTEERERRAQCLEEADLAVSKHLSVHDRVTELGSELAKGISEVERAVKGLNKISEVYLRDGVELRSALGDYTLSQGNERVASEFFIAFREVGEAKVACAERIANLSSRLAAANSQASRTRASCLESASTARRSLVEAEALPLYNAREPAKNWFVRQVAPRSTWTASTEPLEALRKGAADCCEALVEQLQTAQQELQETFVDVLQEARQPAKAVGEKLVHLRPSWRGSSVRASLTIPSPRRSPRSDAGGDGSASSKRSSIQNLVKNLTTAEGRRKLQEMEAAEAAELEEASGGSDAAPEEQLTCPPMLTISPKEWRLKGIYEHQVLKIGLRRLDTWSEETLLQFPKGKDGSSALLCERLFVRLLSGTVKLQSLLGNELAASQRDVHRLSLRQLLRIRVLHLDFTPSGCGANTINGAGGTHEVFLGLVDSLLFKELGLKAMAALPNAENLNPHQLGRQCVLLTAGAAALQSPATWAWWLDERRLYFDTSNFVLAETFPAGGVLEVTDYSKVDRHEPTGRLKWFDWRVDAVSEEDKLAPCQPPPPPAQLALPVKPRGSEGGESEKMNPAVIKAAATGAATASVVSPGVLGGLRKNLKKVERTRK